MTKWWTSLTKGRRPEWMTWSFFIALLLFAMHVHEPWFDEIQAWFIAKDAPWHDLLWVLPHYEGHPPFFHLLLAIPARLGMSGTLGLPLIGALFSIASAYLIIFKSPFPRVARLCLPFSYFLFYQYSVIVRPYNIMVFLMCLLAVYFPQKDKQPGRFVLLLAALCACHLYAIAIAGGIAIAWLWEMKGSRPWKTYCKELLHDKRFYWLLGLLGWAVMLILWIMPRPDAFAMGSEFQVNSVWKRMFYLLFVMPADVFLTDIFSFDQRLSAIQLSTWELFCSALVGVCVWASVLSCFSKKFRPFLWIPCLCLCIPFAYYLYRHHIGLMELTIVWALWIGWKYNPKRPYYVKLFYLLLLFYPVGWTIVSLYQEVTPPQFSGKPFVQFLREHQLQNKRIFATWYLLRPKDLLAAQKTLYPNGIENTHYMPLATTLDFYAPQNLFANFNENTHHRYNTHQALTEDQNEQTLQTWRRGLPPDLFVGAERLDRLFKDRPEEIQQYAIVYRIEGQHRWKFNKPIKTIVPVYARLELIEPHHLAPQDTLFFFLKLIKG